MSKILICTGIYPPRIGGPAQYAKEVKEELEKRGNAVKVLTYGLEHKLPPLIRHELFFWRTLLSLRGVDFILALDTFSVGWPATIVAKFLKKRIVIRTGGDFLWESYVERTGDLVLFKNFYKQKLSNLNWKERMIFKITKWTLQNVSAVIFSTEWQRKIFEEAYELDSNKSFVVENFYGEKLDSNEPTTKNFLSGGRPVKLKNNPRLVQALSEVQKVDPTIQFSIESVPHDEFMERLKSCYAVILASISDISPNMVLEAIRYNKPFIVTRETGIYEKLKEAGLFVDPEDVQDIKEKVLYLADEANYRTQKEKVAVFTFTHSWSEITDEILAIVKNIHESH